MGSDVVSSCDKDKTSEVTTHGIHKICLSTIVGNIAGCPKVNMDDIKRAAKGPRENEFAIAGNGSIGYNAVGTAKNPISNVFVAMQPEESETDAQKGFVDAHVAMVSQKYIASE
jgi:hypothetical protein